MSTFGQFRIDPDAPLIAPEDATDGLHIAVLRVLDHHHQLGGWGIPPGAFVLTGPDPAMPEVSEATISGRARRAATNAVVLCDALVYAMRTGGDALIYASKVMRRPMRDGWLTTPFHGYVLIQDGWGLPPGAAEKELAQRVGTRRRMPIADRPDRIAVRTAVAYTTGGRLAIACHTQGAPPVLVEPHTGAVAAAVADSPLLTGIADLTTTTLELLLAIGSDPLASSSSAPADAGEPR